MGYWPRMAQPVDLNLLRAFLAIYDVGSFSVAATKLGVPRSTLSRALATLEEQLGVKVEDAEMIPENLDSVNRIAAFVQSKRAAA